ncbi:hypothetical protein Lfu02_40680 [Longispora fulva]|nr:hypothetical protein Lfu02_40680 [Longispora fulva]
MHQIIAAKFLDDFLLVRPGHSNGIKIGRQRFAEIQRATAEGELVPRWLGEAAQTGWRLDIATQPAAEAVLVREPSDFGYSRASYELNLGCNFGCDFCYLGEKRFEGLDLEGRQRLLHILRDAGVLWVQLTGGEPTIDQFFPEVYTLAYQLGMMISISTNGSRLSSPKILELLTTMRPYRITVSVYGATEATYDAVTRRKGTFRKFIAGLDAAHAAGLPLRLNVIVCDANAHEVEAMEALAGRYDSPHQVYANMSPTIYGGPESIPAQSQKYLRARRPFTGCNAGHTFFHVDPHGRASICKVGRDPQIHLMDEGLEGLRRLGGIADGLMLRQGACTGCTLQGTCGTCPPLVKLYRQAKAPLNMFCQH